MLKILLSISLAILVSATLWAAEDPAQYNKSEQLLQTPNQAKAKNLETTSKSDTAAKASSRSDDRTKAKERTSSRSTKRY